MRIAVVTVLAVSLLAWWFSGWRPIPSIHGYYDARIDVAHGQYKILSYGLPTMYRPKYATLLRQRYGVEMKVVAGCVVTPSLMDYVAAYNNVSTEAVNHNYGYGVFQKTYDEVKKDWEQTHR